MPKPRRSTASRRRAGPAAPRRTPVTDPATRRVAMLAYPDVQILDVTGPLEVFSRTARWLNDHRGRDRDAYVVEILGLERGPFRASSGLRLHADRAYHEVTGGIDTLLLAGGRGTHEHDHDRRIIAWVKKQATRVRRLG